MELLARGLEETVEAAYKKMHWAKYSKNRTELMVKNVQGAVIILINKSLMLEPARERESNLKHRPENRLRGCSFGNDYFHCYQGNKGHVQFEEDRLSYGLRMGN